MVNRTATEQTAQELRVQYESMEEAACLLKVRFGHVPRAFVHSFGCQANAADGETLRGMLAQMGCDLTEQAQDADLILFNTCAVRKSAEDKVLGHVGELSHLKQRHPELLVVLCGCMTQQEQVAAKIQQSYPQVDLLLGTHAMHRFPELLLQTLAHNRRVFDLKEDAVIAEGLPIRREGSAKAWVQIMYGCDNFCTYCIVPYVRGRERSRRPERIVEEITELVGAGCKEITLLGQNVNSYGKGLNCTFPQLLLRINAIAGDFRVRFLTSHPKDCTHELIDAIAACDKVCHHIHLPVQSGSDRILRLMNRGYTRQQYLDLTTYARQRLPGVTFTSDIIVGFPGETQEDFLETLSLVREVGYDALFTFLYSRREGTRAAQWEDATTEEEKSRRFTQLQAVQSEVSASHNAALVGKTLRVLCEQQGGEDCTGRADGNEVVAFCAPPGAQGRFLQIRVTGAKSWAVTGVPIL